LIKFSFKPLEEREGVSRAPGEPCDDGAAGEAANLSRVAFDDGLAQTDLTVARDRDGAVTPDGQNRRAVHHRHGSILRSARLMPRGSGELNQR
jgi:hypothetical protein